VAISEEGVEFDGDKVKWVDVIEIRTRSLVEYLFTGGIYKQADKLPLPWFPFRRKVIEAISRAALTLLLAASNRPAASVICARKSALSAGNRAQIP
jgi:hypothetical protein